jgi:hypothetical protein
VVHQQSDQQTAERTDQEGEQARIHADRERGLLPDQPDGSIDKSYKNKSDQGTDNAHQGHQRHQSNIGLWFCLCVDHDSLPCGCRQQSIVWL